MQEKLLVKTVKLMKRLNLPTSQVKEICDTVGKTQRWYHQVRTGSTKNPGVNTVEKLYQILSDLGEKKKVA